MAVRLDDARIKIELDVNTAKRQLDELEKNVKEIDQNRQRLEAEKKDKDRVDSSDRVREKNAASRARFSIVEKIRGAISDATSFAKLGEKAATGITGLLSEGARAIGLDTIADMIDQKVNAAADKLSRVIAEVESKVPALQQIIDYNVASGRLGGRLPSAEEQLKVSGEIIQITRAQEELRRNQQRDIDRETVRVLGKSIKDAMK